MMNCVHMSVYRSRKKRGRPLACHVCTSGIIGCHAAIVVGVVTKADVGRDVKRTETRLGISTSPIVVFPQNNIYRYISGNTGMSEVDIPSPVSVLFSPLHVY